MSSFYGNVCICSSNGGNTPPSTTDSKLVFCAFNQLPSIGDKETLYVTEQGMFYYNNGQYISVSSALLWSRFPEETPSAPSFDNTPVPANEYIVFCPYNDLPSTGAVKTLYVTELGIYYYDEIYILASSAIPQWGSF